MSPAEFIPIAEENGLVLPLGERMFELGVADLPTLSDALDVADGLLWINVSTRQLDEPGFVDAFIDGLRESGVVGRVGVEVTETGLTHDASNAASSLYGLASAGVPIAIDDFGTGYSSLARLIEFPVDLLKIDQYFVQSLASRDTEPVIAAMVELARAIGARTCAEGIETADQLRRIVDLGVDLLSGFHLGRPVPAEELAASLREPRRLLRESIGSDSIQI